MVTLRDIARHTGLSESTVSRVLNGKGRVGQSTRLRVMRCAEELNYHPNYLAQSLKLQRATTVGVVVPDISNEFYALLFKELDTRLAPMELTPVLFNIGKDEDREETFLNHLRSSVLDAMVVATAGSDAYAALPADLLARIVFVDNLPALAAPVAFVGADNVGSSEQLTQHLIDRGHTRIATVVGSASESSAVHRLQGFEETLRRSNLDLPEHWVARTNFHYDDGYAKAALLLRGAERPTAIIAQNNVLAYATIRVARHLGLAVPGDVAVACFDHIDTYGFMRPVITTMVQPLNRIADRVCSLLQAGLDGHDTVGVHQLAAEFRRGETS